MPNFIWREARACRRYLVQGYSTQRSTDRPRRSWLGKATAALLGMAAILVLGGLESGAQAQAHVTPGHPLPPAGYRPPVAAGPVAPSDPARAPGVRAHRVHLPAAVCHAWNRARPGAAPNCMAIHYVSGGTHRALPRGTRTAGSLHAASVSADSGYWYWSWRDDDCSTAGCWLADFYSWEDGVANGSSVWNWDHGCGGGPISWCGDLYNGGGWPYYAIQYGLDSGDPYNYGIRRWIDDSGSPAGYDAW